MPIDHFPKPHFTPLLLVVVLCGLSTSAFGQVCSFLATVDENGHGSATSASCVQTLTLSYSVIPDPGPGGRPNVLAYNLFPTTFFPGDVILLDPNTNTISDVIRFSTTYDNNFAPISSTLFFYSAIELGESALADIGLPTAFNSNVVTIYEGQLYIPLVNDAGRGPDPGLGDGAIMTYNFDSGVPEPASLLSMISGAGLILLLKRRSLTKRSFGIPVHWLKS